MLESRCLLAAGSVDSTFGTDGQILLDFYGRLDWANAIAVQPDGMIVVAGQADNLTPLFQPRAEIVVARFTSDGELDADFADEGLALLEFGDEQRGGGAGRIANGLAIQADGKILVVGDRPFDSPADLLRFQLIRLNTDGTLDADFNNSGLITSDLFSGSDVVVQPDGKIVVVGSARGPLGFQIFVARFHSDGSFDSSFADDGAQFTNILTPRGSVAAAAIQPDGRILVVGYAAADAPQPTSLVVARYQVNGSLDPSFDNDGLVFTSLSADTRASDVAIQPDGKIVVVGSDQGSLVVARYNDDGSLDNHFDQDGVRQISGLNPVVDGTTGGSVLIQPDGKLVVTASGGNDFVVLRLHPDGTDDPSFNSVGKVVVDLQGTFDSSTAIALQQDGQLVVAGQSGGDWAVMRFEGDPIDPVIRPWQNAISRFDVSGDGRVVPLDVLRVINELNEPRIVDPRVSLPATRPAEAPFFDVDGNGFLTPLDALAVINHLNALLLPDGEADLDSWFRGLDTILGGFGGPVEDDILLADLSWLGSHRPRR